MQPQDHSDTTLLVWSDWLEENEQEQNAHDLREEIVNPPARRWDWEYPRHGVGSSPIGERVGGGCAVDYTSSRIGPTGYGIDVGGHGGGHRVGGVGDTVGGGD